MPPHGANGRKTKLDVLRAATVSPRFRLGQDHREAGKGEIGGIRAAGLLVASEGGGGGNARGWLGKRTGLAGMRSVWRGDRRKLVTVSWSQAITLSTGNLFPVWKHGGRTQLWLPRLVKRRRSPRFLLPPGHSLPPRNPHHKKTLPGEWGGERGQGGNRSKAGDLSKLSPGFPTKQHSEYVLIRTL